MSAAQQWCPDGALHPAGQDPAGHARLPGEWKSHRHRLAGGPLLLAGRGELCRGGGRAVLQRGKGEVQVLRFEVSGPLWQCLFISPAKDLLIAAHSEPSPGHLFNHFSSPSEGCVLFQKKNSEPANTGRMKTHEKLVLQLQVLCGFKKIHKKFQGNMES